MFGRSRPRCRRCRWRRSARPLSVEAPSQAYSQSWIVPAPLVARWVSQPPAIIRSSRSRGAVAQQVRAVDQDDGGAALARRADRLRAVVDHGREPRSEQGGRSASGSSRISSTLRQAVGARRAGRTFSLPRSSGSRSRITPAFLHRPSR